MGFWSDVGNRIRGIFSRDKERLALQLAKGSTAAGYPTTGYDLLQAYGYDVISDYLKLEHDLLARYVDYEEMDDYPEIAASIDIFADDATQTETQLNRTVWVTSKDRDVELLLNNLFHRTLRMDEEVWEIARTLVKYGNDFEELLVTADGVRGFNFLPPPTVRRIEGPRGQLFGFVQDFKGRFGYCLARGSRVWSSGGLEEIQDFGSKAVLGYKDGKLTPLDLRQKHANGTKRVFRLRTRHREVFLTEDHPVLVERLGVREWVKVKDLKIVRYQGKKQNIDYSRSDKLVICTRMPKGELPAWTSIWKFDPFETKWGKKGSPKELDLPERPTPEFCRLFGFLLGDGWTEGMTDAGTSDEPYAHEHHKGEEYERESRTAPRVSYARGIYPELNDLYDGLLRSFGMEVKIEAEGRQSRVNSVQFVRLLHALGWIPGAENKRIPSWVFTLPEEHREAFLTGFIDADGWDTETTAGLKGHHTEIANYDLVRDLKNLIDGLGYHSGNIGSRTREPGTVVTNRKTGKQVVVQTQLPCFNLHYSEQKFDEPFVVENLLDLSYYEDAEVFDLEVTDEAHNFISDGVVVHNSPAEFQQILAMRASAVGNKPSGKLPDAGGLEKIAALEDWEVVHFRLRGKHRRSIYGYSSLEPARWIWKRLMLLEDAALIYRLQRAPERYAFYVDTGDLPPMESLAYTNRVRQQFKKRKFFNPTTGKLDLKYEALAQDEDFFIPVRKGAESTRVEVLGSPQWQHMDDIEYFRDKLFASMKVPKSYLGQEQGVARAVLSSEDVRFARTVLRVQREIRNGLGKVCRVHMAALNIDPYAADYDIRMTVPSAIFELAQLEVRNARADLAGRMRDFVSLYWILSKVFGCSDSEIQEITKQRGEDAMRDTMNQAKAEAEAQKLQQPSMEGPPEGGPPEEGPPEGEEEPEGEAPPEDVQAAESRLSRRPIMERHRGRIVSPYAGQSPFASRYGNRARGISERELFKGNREAEKRAEGKLDQLLNNDMRLAKRLSDLGGLIQDIGSFGGHSGGRTGGGD